VVLAVILSWALAAAAPGGLAGSAARAEGRAVQSPEVDLELARAVVSAAARRHGLDDGVATVIGRSVRGVLVGDFGSSWRHGTRVAPLVGRSLVPTLVLVFVVLVVGGALGLWAAVRASVRPGPLLAAASAIALAVPPLWLGILAIDAFASDTGVGLFPRHGWGSPLALVLPVVTLAPVVFAVVFRHTGAVLREFLQSPAALAAQARGLSVREVARHHGLRVSAAALAPLGTTLVAYLIGATVVTDRLFDVRGLGWMLLDAAAIGDVPVVVAAVAASAFAVALVSVAADALARHFDPRLRTGDDAKAKGRAD